MRKYFLPLLSALCLIPVLGNANNCLVAAAAEPDSITIKKCKDFKITGNGISNEWNSTSWINIIQQEGKSSSYKTKSKILYSETGVYFLFHCEDQKLTSTMKADNLNLYEEDVVEVFLWPDEQFPVYFEYELSPYNFELPIIVPNKNGNFLGWLPWHYDGDRMTRHATSVTGGTFDRGGAVTAWIAEFFIPYKLLNPLIQSPPVSGNHWRANMYRIDYDNGEILFEWQKTLKTFHEYNKFGTFIFE